MYERILREMALNGFKYASSKKAPKLGLFLPFGAADGT